MPAAKKTAARKTVKSAEAAAKDTYKTAENMSNAARDQFDTMVASFTDNAETMRGHAEDVMETFRDNFETAQTRFQSVNADMIEAAREEASEAAEFMNSLARAKNVGDAFEIQRDYWTNFFDNRVQRTRELTQTATDAARESFEPVSKSMSAFSDKAMFEKFMPFAVK